MSDQGEPADLAPDFGMANQPNEPSPEPVPPVPTEFPDSMKEQVMAWEQRQQMDAEQKNALKVQARIEAGDDWRDRYNQLLMESGEGVDMEVYNSVPSIMVTSIEVYKASVQWTWRGKDVSGTVVARSPRSWPTKEDVVNFLRGLFPNTDPVIVE